MKITAIVLAAGRGSRVASPIPKQFIEVNSKPVLVYCLESFEKSCVDDVIVVTSPDSISYVKEKIVDAFSLKKVRQIVAGGSERYFSVYNGLKAAEGSDYVLIHDGARPYISKEGIEELVLQVQKHPAVIAAARSKDTVKIADDQGFVSYTTNRANTWIIQTPQCFEYEAVYEAYKRIIGPLEEKGSTDASITDDSMVYEKAYPERKVLLFNAFEENSKITCAGDLEIMKSIIGK